MDPAIYHITIGRGVTWLGFSIICKNSEGAVVPLAGWSAFAEVRKDYNDELVLDLKPVIEPNDAEGKVTLPEIPHDQTRALPAGQFKYDVILQTPAGQRLEPVLAGVVDIPAPITQPSITQPA